jgi:hypothetical protein
MPERTEEAIRRRLERLRERNAGERPRADRLVVEDHAADELLDPRSGEEELAVRAAGVLGRLDVDRVEALLDRAAALVRREDPFALGDERSRNLFQAQSLRHGRHRAPSSISSGGLSLLLSYPELSLRT